MKYLWILLLISMSAWGQVNGYSVPASEGGPLKIPIGPGKIAKNDGTVVSYAGGTLTLTANSTIYGYVDNTGTPQTGTSVPAGDYPLFKAITGTANITSITDLRTQVFFPVDQNGANAWTGAQTQQGMTFYANANNLSPLKCDDTTDDTTALNNLLSAVNTAGGGTIVFPANKLCLISGQITFPNDGQATPHQSSIRLTAQGGPANGYWGTLPTGSGGLDLRFNAPAAKILTLGAGKLEIDHIYLTDGGTDCATFIYDTNTTLLIHDDTFKGTTPSNGTTNACNNAIQLASNSTTIGGAVGDAFQGYGTVIRDNFFSQMQQIVLAFSFVNNIVVANNTISKDCGDTTAAAFDFTGNSPTATDASNIIANNTIELTHYLYGVHFQANAQSNLASGNGCWDVGSIPNNSCVRDDSGGINGAPGNTVILGFYPGTAGFATQQITETPGMVFGTSNPGGAAAMFANYASDGTGEAAGEFYTNAGLRAVIGSCGSSCAVSQFANAAFMWGFAGNVVLDSRLAGGIVRIFTGGSAAGNERAQVTDNGIRNIPVTFSNLAACASGLEGTHAAVTDSTTATWGATITGSGTNHVLAYCDGTNWTVAAK